jgi:type II secretory pathway pseudopilin PulG
VIAIIGIIAAIAIPALRYAVLWSQATRMVTDFNLFRTALVEYVNDEDAFPPETGPGLEPPELAAYLEGRLEWTEPTFAWDWENWRGPAGTPIQPQTGVVYGLTVRATDPALLQMIDTAWEGEGREIAGYGYTFVIEGVGSVSASDGNGDPDPPAPTPAPTPPQDGGGALDPASAVLAAALAWAALRPRREP